MVTTEASADMAAIHSRMPAVLRPDTVQAFLDGGDGWTFLPYDGTLVLKAHTGIAGGKIQSKTYDLTCLI